MQYDANGIRTRKIVPGLEYFTTTEYLYSGNNLLREIVSLAGPGQSSTTYKAYFYNSQGLVGFVQSGITYTYRKNMFGDIVAIYQGATKVAEYAYDAWGNCTVTNLTSSMIGTYNPFRYRGYYWDKDLNLYYLMSRYYDPVTGRFINADSLEYLEPDTINGLNLYAYCLNNPIMHADPSGHSIVLISLIVGAILGFATATYVDYKDDGEIFNGSVAWYDYLGATIVGGAIGASFGYMAPAIAEFAATSFTIGSGLAISAGGTAAVTAGLTITGAEVLATAGLLGILLFAKGSGPRMGHNQHEKHQWDEAMRRLGYSNDKDMQQRIHRKLDKYPYQETLKGLLKVIKKILEKIGK